MRQKRVKTYRKVMRMYCSTFQFREPYQLLVDADFALACVQQKLEFQARLEDVLQGSVKPMITQCSIQALYDQGASGQPAVELAKGFERRMCNHFKVRPEAECLTSMAGGDNKNRYVFATQSMELRKTLRAVPGTPIIYLNRSVVLLETPSDQTLRKKELLERAKLHIPTTEKAVLNHTAAVPSNSSNLIDAPLPTPLTLPSDPEPSTSTSTSVPTSEPPKKKKKKGLPGPNPLSVKKKAKPVGEGRGLKRSRDEEGPERAARKKPREDGEKGRVDSLAKRRVADGTAGKRKRKRAGKKEGGEAVQSGDGVAPPTAATE